MKSNDMIWICDYLDWVLDHFKAEAKRDEDFAIKYYANILNGDYFRKIGCGGEAAFARDYVKRSAKKLYKFMLKDKSFIYFHR